MVMILFILYVLAVFSVHHQTDAADWKVNNEVATRVLRPLTELEESCATLRSVIKEMQEYDFLQADEDAMHMRSLYTLLCSQLHRSTELRKIDSTLAMKRRGWREELLASMLKNGN